MSDFVKTITNNINLFGPAVSTKWGQTNFDTFVFGSSKWGEGTSLLTEFEKVVDLSSFTVTSTVSNEPGKYLSDDVTVSNVIYKEPEKFIFNSQVVTNAVYKEPEKLFAESVVTSFLVLYKDVDKVVENQLNPTTDILREVEHTIYNSFAVSGDLSCEKKYIGDWAYIFVNSANAENRGISSWTSGSHDSSIFTTLAATTTSWTTST